MLVEKAIAVLIGLSLAGGALKVYGSVAGGSKSVFVDAMTSVANTLSIVLILKFFRAGMEPPDTDHHYGHHRLVLGGSISMLMLYSFVLGVVVLDLVNTFGREYRVGLESPAYAALALIPYGIAIALARRTHSVVAGYAGFTMIEFIESLVSISSSVGGATVSYVIDFAGAAALMAYLIYELTKSFREVVVAISDVAPSEVIDRIRSVVRERGLDVERVRVRRVLEDVYHGDLVLRVTPGMTVEEAHSIADDIERELKMHGIDVSVHLEPEKGGESRGRTRPP